MYFALMTRNIAIAKCQNIYFNNKKGGENVHLYRIDCAY